jgi:hypothetical protein
MGREPFSFMGDAALLVFVRVAQFVRSPGDLK